MKLSVLDLVPVLGGAAQEEALAQAVRLARKAECLGYYRYWAAEHHDLEGLACASPEVLLAHIGAQTHTIRLGSGALLLPHYKPIKVAESFRLLAALYPERIDLGIGRAPGGSAHVSMALSGNFLDNVRRFPDSLKDLLDLLTDQFELEGQPVRARPFPMAAPHVWLLGTNHKSAAYAAEYGTGYVFGRFMSDADGLEVLDTYRKQFQPSKLLSKPQVIVAIGVVCAETADEAKSLAAEGAAWFSSANTPAIKTEVDANTKLLIGTSGQIGRQLKELCAVYGADEWIIVSPITDYDKRIRSYELLAEAVL